MGWSFRKSFRIGPFRLNLSKSGAGVSTGVGGARISAGPRGIFASVSKFGIRYSKRIAISQDPQNKASTSGPKINNSLTQAARPVPKTTSSSNPYGRFKRFFDSVADRLFSNRSASASPGQQSREELDARAENFRSTLIQYLTVQPPQLFDFDELVQTSGLTSVHANDVADQLFMNFARHAAKDGRWTDQERIKLKTLAGLLKIDERRASVLFQRAKMPL